MQLSIVLALAGLAVALPSPVTGSVPSKPENVTIPPAFHPDRIISSENLHAYLQKNHELNHTIFLKDTGVVVDLSTIEISQPKNLDSGNSTNSKRAPPDWSCYTHKQQWAEQVQSWWDSWNPASSCLSNGFSPLPATQNIGWSYSKSIATNAGLDWKIIKDVLSITAGISVTETWTDSGFVSCQIPGGSIGQIWIQNKIVWGWMWERTCQSCTGSPTSCWGATAKGGASAPVSTKNRGVGVQYGCSTGWDKVRC